MDHLPIFLELHARWHADQLRSEAEAYRLAASGRPRPISPRVRLARTLYALAGRLSADAVQSAGTWELVQAPRR